MKSFASVGDPAIGVSFGVGGKEGIVVVMGVGRDGIFDGGAIGRVSESLLEFRDAVESDRVDREPNDGAGDHRTLLSSIGIGGGGGIGSGGDVLETWREWPERDLEWTILCLGSSILACGT